MRAKKSKSVKRKSVKRKSVKRKISQKYVPEYVPEIVKQPQHVQEVVKPLKVAKKRNYLKYATAAATAAGGLGLSYLLYKKLKKKNS